MAREKPEIWRCDHHYPIAVEKVRGAERARCLGCGGGGPPRASAEQALQALLALLALRAEARAWQRWEPNPPSAACPTT